MHILGLVHERGRRRRSADGRVSHITDGAQCRLRVIRQVMCDVRLPPDVRHLA